MGIEKTLLDGSFLPWEQPSNIVQIKRLSDIPLPRGRVLLSVVRIYRRGSDNRKLSSLRHDEKINLSRVYDHYGLDVFNGDGVAYVLNNPLLHVDLGLDYDNLERAGRKTYQSPRTAVFVPSNPARVAHTLANQILAHAKILQELTGLIPRVWITREDSPRDTYYFEINPNRLPKKATEPLITQYAFAGR